MDCESEPDEIGQHGRSAGLGLYGREAAAGCGGGGDVGGAGDGEAGDVLVVKGRGSGGLEGGRTGRCEGLGVVSVKCGGDGHGGNTFPY